MMSYRFFVAANLLLISGILGFALVYRLDLPTLFVGAGIGSSASGLLLVGEVRRHRRKITELLRSL